MRFRIPLEFERRAVVVAVGGEQTLPHAILCSVALIAWLKSWGQAGKDPNCSSAVQRVSNWETQQVHLVISWLARFVTCDHAVVACQGKF